MRVEDDVALALKAGAAVVANLLDRRGIKQALWEIDDDVRAELAETVGRLALAAVAPAIEAAALERAAVVVDSERATLCKYRDVFERMGNDEAVRARQPEIETLARIAAAIRALKETT